MRMPMFNETERYETASGREVAFVTHNRQASEYEFRYVDDGDALRLTREAARTVVRVASAKSDR